MKPSISTLTLALAGLLCASASAAPGRQTQSLDGTWQIADGKSPDEIPAAFTHTVPAPGLANLATPAFKDVDHYETHEFTPKKETDSATPEGR